MNSTTSSLRSPPSYLIFGDEGLLLLQAKGEGMLGQPGGLARPDHQLAKGGLIGRMDGFADPAGG